MIELWPLLSYRSAPRHRFTATVDRVRTRRLRFVDRLTGRGKRAGGMVTGGFVLDFLMIFFWLNYSDLKSRDLTGIMVRKRYPHGGPNNSGWIVIIYPDEWWRMVNKWFRICAYCSWIFSGCGRWETQGSQGQKLTFRGWMVYEIGWIPHDAWFFYGVKHGKTTPF